MKAAKHEPRVYSYIRFSTPEQALGDSERRQVEQVEAFARQKGMPFDEMLTDRGLSGYHGRHRKKGDLGAFLRRVKTGEIPKGSILVVENIDRLGREAVTDALKTIVFGLLENDITIETLYPPDTYSKESINSGGIWKLVAHIERAHGESRRKSDLGKANWKQKRKLAAAGKAILTKRVPAWLRVTRDEKFEVIPEAAEALRLIFKWKLEGYGKGWIEKKLNASAPWMPPANPKRKTFGWRESYVHKILRDPSVIGLFQPHKLDGDGKRVPDGDPIENYYPAAIEPDLFYAVQDRFKQNRNTGGRTGKARNLFQSIVKCGYCEGPMVLEDKGPSSKGGRYLVCYNGKRGVICERYRVRYDELENTILANCRDLNANEVLPSEDENAKRQVEVKRQLEANSERAAQLEKQIENFLDQIGVTENSSIRVRYEQRVEALEEEKKELAAQANQATKELEALQRDRESFKEWQQNLEGLKQAITQDVESRIRLRAHLRTFIKRIDVFAHGHDEQVDHAIELIHEYIPEAAQAPSFPAFRKFLRERLRSYAGRFYRVHFVTGRGTKVNPQDGSLRKGQRKSAKAKLGTMVGPQGSLGFRSKLTDAGREVQGPDLAALAEEFFDFRKPGFVPKPRFIARSKPVTI